MSKKYFEVIFEGKPDIINGMIEGFILGKGVKWEWFSGSENFIETESFIELMKELASLKHRHHYYILEEELYNTLHKALADAGDLVYVKLKYIKSAKIIKNSSFRFNAEAFSEKHATEIRALLETPPAGVTLTGYKPVEKTDKSAKGDELYSPAHEYEFKCEGLVSGEVDSIISFRKTLEENSLIVVEKIKLDL